MKSAEEILNANYYHRSDPEIDFDGLIGIINSARIDVINECAQRATADTEWHRGRFTGNAYVNEQSILNLINEVR